MQRCTLELMFLVISFVDCLAAPLAPSESTNISANDAPLIMGETTVTTHLHLAPHSGPARNGTPAKREHGDARRTVNEVAKGKQTADELDNDYTLLAEKPPDRIEDDYTNVGEDSTATNQHHHVPLSKPQAIVRPYAVPGASPIYITIPIYLNTVAGLPITLQVGGQKIPLNSNKSSYADSIPKDPSPTSQFNRLL